MTQKLGRYGIPVRTARNAALAAALAADLPSPILAHLTGMHHHTALRWVAYAKRDWAAYLAARTADRMPPYNAPSPARCSSTCIRPTGDFTSPSHPAPHR
ncbi:hypothetical protein [Streptomyces sp. NPDC005303]|uniref:hypothetical protein n=1 Tax=Streptomyces sp. NPDC005303 TaxID=3155713 RepID=UPI0033A5BF05